jgi:hypothetical protein
MSWVDKLFAFAADAFRPPFRTTPMVVLIYIVLSVVYNPGSHFNHWTFPDTDDYMRFSQVFHWLDGQSWFDLRIPQLYPQHVISMHWGRLPDIPIAGLLLLFQSVSHFFQWNAERTGLAMLVAFIVPCFLLYALLRLVKFGARPILGRAYAGLACFMVPLSLQLIFQFTPMRVDHHSYFILASGFAFIALQCMALNVRPGRMALLSGAAVGLAMWNGAEILPTLGIFSACLTVLMLIKGGKTFSYGILFALAMLGSAFIVLLIARSPAERWVIEFDAFSFFYVIIAALAALYFCVLYIAGRVTRHKIILGLLAVFTALVTGDLLLTLYPGFILGPYGQVNPLLDVLFFSNIREAVPFINAWLDLKDNFSSTPGQVVGGAIFFFTTRLFAPLVGSAVCIARLTNQHLSRREKMLWFFYTAFCLFYLALAMFWQVRVITYAQLFALAPVMHLMLRYLKTLPRHYQGRRLYAWELITVLSFTILPTVIVPGIIMQSKLNPDVMFFTGGGSQMPCKDRTHMVSFLHQMDKDRKKPATILAPMDYTPELIFSTGQNYIAAPYHRNSRGILDMITFFRSRDTDASGRAIAKKLDLDYVLVCKESYYQGTLFRTTEVKNISVNVTADNLEMKPDEKDLLESSLGFRLAYGKAPTWLKRVEIPLDTQFALYQVKKDKLGQPMVYAKEKKN